MLFKIFSSKVIDTILLKSEPKYKIKTINNKKDNPTIVSEIISSGSEVTFKIKDLITDDKLKYFSPKDILTISNVFNNIYSASVTDKRTSQDYNLLTQIFIVILIVSNISVSKILDINSITLSGGMIMFPMLYSSGFQIELIQSPVLRPNP